MLKIIDDPKIRRPINNITALLESIVNVNKSIDQQNLNSSQSKSDLLPFKGVPNPLKTDSMYTLIVMKWSANCCVIMEMHKLYHGYGCST